MKHIPESVRLTILDLAPHTPVRVHTLQHRSVLDRARERGYITGEPDYIDDPDQHQWKRAYDWMRGRMAERIPDYSGDYPIWAWLKRQNMRQWAHRPDHVLIVAEIPRGRMVLSDYDLWYCALNGWFAHPTEAAFEADADVEPSPLAVEASWARIFDLRERQDPAERAWLGQPDRVQICIDRIYLDEIRSVRDARGRGRT